MAGRADLAGRVFRRLGAFRHGGPVSGGIVELAPGLSLDEVDLGQLRDSQLLGAARPLARASRAPIRRRSVLAAESTGDARMARGAVKLAEAVARGESAATALQAIDRRTFLPMLRWVLATGQEQGSLVAALRNLAEVYRKRAQYQADKLSVFLPVILMIAIGAGATLFYALALFIPLTELLRELTLA